MANGTYLTVIPQLSRRHVRASELQPMRRSGSCDGRVMMHLVSSCDDYVMMHLVSSCYDRVMIHRVSFCDGLVTIHLKSGFQVYRDSKTCNIIDFVSRYTRKCLFLCIVAPIYWSPCLPPYKKVLCCSHISSFLSFTPRGCAFSLLLVNLPPAKFTRTL